MGPASHDLSSFSKLYNRYSLRFWFQSFQRRRNGITQHLKHFLKLRTLRFADVPILSVSIHLTETIILNVPVTCSEQTQDTCRIAPWKAADLSSTSAATSSLYHAAWRFLQNYWLARSEPSYLRSSTISRVVYSTIELEIRCSHPGELSYSGSMYQRSPGF